MSNIINDIVEEVNIKPNKSKLVLKWVISIAGTLIVLAFAFGQFKSSFFTRLDIIEKKLDKNILNVEQLNSDMNNGFSSIDTKIDKVYDDGLVAFNDFQQYNNKQLGLIIDYGNTNKDLLKRMLEVNTIERSRTFENQLDQAKNESPVVAKTTLEYKSRNLVISMGGEDTVFRIQGATQEYINKIDKNKYSIEMVGNSAKYPGLFDITYKNK